MVARHFRARRRRRGERVSAHGRDGRDAHGSDGRSGGRRRGPREGRKASAPRGPGAASAGRRPPGTRRARRRRRKERGEPPPGSVRTGRGGVRGRPGGGSRPWSRSRRARHRRYGWFTRADARGDRCAPASTCGRRPPRTARVPTDTLQPPRPARRAPTAHRRPWSADLQPPRAERRPPSADCRAPAAADGPPRSNRRPPPAARRPPRAARRAAPRVPQNWSGHHGRSSVRSIRSARRTAPGRSSRTNPAPASRCAVCAPR